MFFPGLINLFVISLEVTQINHFAGFSMVKLVECNLNFVQLKIGQTKHLVDECETKFNQERLGSRLAAY